MTEREPCVVCGSNDWDLDYDLMESGDEQQQWRCVECQWPSVYPATVAEWREHWQTRSAGSPSRSDTQEVQP